MLMILPRPWSAMIFSEGLAAEDRAQQIHGDQFLDLLRRPLEEGDLTNISECRRHCSPGYPRGLSTRGRHWPGRRPGRNRGHRVGATVSRGRNAPRESVRPSRRFPRLREVMARWQPASASISATSNPRFRAPPVTTATFPIKSEHIEVHGWSFLFLWFVVLRGWHALANARHPNWP